LVARAAFFIWGVHDMNELVTTFGFHGKVALVAGAARGLGAQTSEAIAGAGGMAATLSSLRHRKPPRVFVNRAAKPWH